MPGMGENALVVHLHKLYFRYQTTPDMETQLCLSESHSSPTEVSAT
jgi:hypothetical protein